MSIERTNPISGHELTLMPGSPARPNVFGWIRLLNGSQDAGYIYLMDTPTPPRLSSGGVYIVTSVPVGMLQTMLDVLRNERNLQIRFAAADENDPDPSVFIESAGLDGARSEEARTNATRLRSGGA